MVGSAASGWAQPSKPIRLRTETLLAPAQRGLARATMPDASDSAVSGLYLVQFRYAPDAETRNRLSALGASLIQYVPEDAFLSRLESVSLATLRADPEVVAVLDYEPRHKVDPRLRRDFERHPMGSRPVQILILREARSEDRALIARHLRSARVRGSLEIGVIHQGVLDAAGLKVLAQSASVLWIEPAPRMRLVDQVATEIVAGASQKNDGLAALHEMGFNGRGVTVAVADSGVDSGEIDQIHPDLEGRVEALFAYDNLPDASDEHSHGTHCSGIVLGNGSTRESDDAGFRYGLGVAPGARLVGQRIFDGSGDYRPPPSYPRLTQDAIRSGASVGSNSWGDDTGGQYDLSAAEFDALVRDADPDFPGEQPYVLEFSAGNSGPGGQTIGSPAVAKNVIATGATQNNRFEFPLYGEGQEVMADFSSRGPAADGRIKPDITAPGTWIASLRSVFANDNNAWGPISDYYLYQGGTSQAGPHVSGGAAVAIQWFREMHGGLSPSPALVKAMLINSADDMSTAVIPDTGDVLGGTPDDFGGGIVVGDTGPVPNNDEGWGRMNLVTLIDSERRHEFTDQGAGLTNGAVFERTVVVGSGDVFKVTLVYTDVPGLPAALPALVNDLDLEIIAPNGDKYRGNAFAEGESIPGTPDGDRVNNVEAVHIGEPAAGEWIVRVRGHRVVQDVHQRNRSNPEQDFALVVSGQLPAPGEAVVSWDRAAYRPDATATVRVTDADLRIQTSVNVQIRSSTEPAGLPVTLNRLGTSGTFQGVVSLHAGPVVTDDLRLSVVDGDELTAVFQDLSPAGERSATAQIDAQPPLVSDVLATSGFGRTTVRWLTSELAWSVVRFGTTNQISQSITNLGLRSQHLVAFPPLIAGETYFFEVVATDAAGNVSTHNNDGRYFRFIAPRPANALLVYSPESLFAEGGLLSETPYPGIETWTGPLSDLNVDYEIWDVGVIGRTPTAAEMTPYRVVLWRPEELQPPPAGFPSALTAYVEAGGNLFVSSFDLLTRLTEVQASTFITNVLHVAGRQEDGGAFAIAGLTGDPVGGGKAFDLDYTEFPSGFLIDILGIVWSDGPDHLNAATNASPTYLQESGRPVGIRFPKTGQDSAGGRVVFQSFALESIPVNQEAPNNRKTVLADALRFLSPELVAGSKVSFDQASYTIPGNAVVEVTDSKRAGVGRVKVAVVVDGRSVELSLTETVRRGVFRGRFTVSPSDAPPGIDQIPARNGSRIVATYMDSGAQAGIAEAGVDTQAPRISSVSSEAAYNEAYISWTTDKPTDALVRYGESRGDDSFLSRTAYSAELATEHQVLIRGLLPDRDYFFQVVSRDGAGNWTRDNNGGTQYVVRTLKPLKAPWVDDLEVERPGWAVYNEDGGTGAVFPGTDDDGGGELRGTGWTWGVPRNGAATGAHSGSRVWATNLSGDDVDFGISDLISPAISLVGGNRAKLRFWQYYDFSVAGGTEEDPFGDFVLEAAQVALSTDNGASWKDLYIVGDEFSSGWEEVEVDLTKFLGSVIRLRFNYQLFSFNPAPRLGWLLDDIAVEMTTLPEGTLTVTNNLAQASFTLQGAMTISGEGLTFRTNITPGQYVVSWKPVPFYETPAPQTNTLVMGVPLMVRGDYRFVDANLNGISDQWETRYFGAVRNGYSGLADSDADGVADRDEWQMGTVPTDPTSRLALGTPDVLPDGRVRFQWPTIPGHEYRFETSNDLAQWLPAGDVVRGTGSPVSVTLPTLDPRMAFYFRITVVP